MNLTEIRSQTNYRTFRAVINTVAGLSYVLAGLILLGVVAGAFSTDGPIFVIPVGIAWAGIHAALTRFVQTFASLQADMADTLLAIQQDTEVRRAAQDVSDILAAQNRNPCPAGEPATV